MRDRLIELLQDIDHYPEKTCPKYGTGEECGDCQYKLETEKGCDLYARKADYMIAKGLMYPPCKVGEDVWCIVKDLNQVLEGHVRRITVLDGFINVYCGVRGYYEQVYTNEEFQDMVFLTKEEAEQALRKGDE